MENNDSESNAVFLALADPTRRAVVQRLSRGNASVSALAAPFDMGLPAFLKHISLLEDSGVIGTSKSGRVRTCWLKVESLAPLEKWFEQQRENWNSRHDNLDTLLTKLTGDNRDET